MSSRGYSTPRRTPRDSMKLLQPLTVLCFAAVVVAAPFDKQKRNILPGDPRYGKELHDHHHHSEVQISKSLGNYVGSYSTPDALQSYGPPEYQPGTPIGGDYHQSSINENSVHLPADTYGIPTVTKLHKTVKDTNRDYLPPVEQPKETYQLPTTYGTPFKVQKETPSTDYVPPTPEAPVTSYGEPLHLDVKPAENVHKPITSYGTPVLKEPEVSTHDNHQDTSSTSIHKIEIPHADHTHLTKTKIVHDHTSKITLPSSQEIVKEPLPTDVLATNPFAPDNSHAIENGKGIDVSLGSKLKLDSSVPFLPSAQLGLDFSSNLYSGFNNPLHGYHINTLNTNLPSTGFHNHEFNVQLPQTYESFHTHNPVIYGLPLTQPIEIPKVYYLRAPQPFPVAVGHQLPIDVSQTLSYPADNQYYADTKRGGSLLSFLQDSLPNLQIPNLQFIHNLLKPTTTPSTTTVADTEEEAKYDASVSNDDVTIENPIPSITSNFAKTTLTSSKGYTQPVDQNGGYIY